MADYLKEPKLCYKVATICYNIVQCFVALTDLNLQNVNKIFKTENFVELEQFGRILFTNSGVGILFHT